ncbi:uncharacterized protein LOC124831751 [Vigna umbellata]|uniref:uncharacterized protein LOC124831751 n=1 Tax=Vigna umbellata TaxID=87088 RepID=UPI001F5F79C6|nr:uncharacterized protein LOC124831751 [Vigna umbellata]
MVADLGFVIWSTVGGRCRGSSDGGAVEEPYFRQRQRQRSRSGGTHDAEVAIWRNPRHREAEAEVAIWRNPRRRGRDLEEPATQRSRSGALSEAEAEAAVTVARWRNPISGRGRGRGRDLEEPTTQRSRSGGTRDTEVAIWSTVGGRGRGSSDGGAVEEPYFRQRQRQRSRSGGTPKTTISEMQQHRKAVGVRKAEVAEFGGFVIWSMSDGQSCRGSRVDGGRGGGTLIPADGAEAEREVATGGTPRSMRSRSGGNPRPDEVAIWSTVGGRGRGSSDGGAVEEPYFRQRQRQRQRSRSGGTRDAEAVMEEVENPRRRGRMERRRKEKLRKEKPSRWWRQPLERMAAQMRRRK